MRAKSRVEKFTFWARNIRAGEMFEALQTYCKGDVLDVGGRDFFTVAKSKGLKCRTWTTLENTIDNAWIFKGEDRYRLVFGDGCNMCFKTNRFDTVINVLVLEHVFEPQKMVYEISRVLKPQGYGIFLIPQTSVLHELPFHYYNFTRFWIEKVMMNANLDVVAIKPQGGFWSSVASHLVYFFFKCFRVNSMTPKDCRRNIWFYMLCPFMLIYAVLSIPICMIFSMGDLTEEANNHLVIVKKIQL